MGLRGRSLGRSGLVVSELGFGGAPLGDLYALLDDAEAIGAVEAAIAGGVNLIDTSPLYGHGLSEHRIGTALRRAKRDQLVLSTKVGRVLFPAQGEVDREGYRGGLPFSARFDYSRDGALRSLEQSLQRLGTARVEIALIHDVDKRNHGAALEARYREALEGAYPALAELRAAGVVKAIGIGVNETEIATRFVRDADLDVVMLAGRYSLLEQGALDAFLPLASARKVGVMLGGVFNSGILATGPIPGATYDYAPASPEIRARVARLEAVCLAHAVPLPIAAMRFPLGHPAVGSIVLGAVSRAEVERNLAGLAWRVPADLWADLKAEGLIRADAPVPEGRS